MPPTTSCPAVTRCPACRRAAIRCAASAPATAARHVRGRDHGGRRHAPSSGGCGSARSAASTRARCGPPGRRSEAAEDGGRRARAARSGAAGLRGRGDASARAASWSVARTSRWPRGRRPAASRSRSPAFGRRLLDAGGRVPASIAVRTRGARGRAAGHESPPQKPPVERVTPQLSGRSCILMCRQAELAPSPRARAGGPKAAASGRRGESPSGDGVARSLRASPSAHLGGNERRKGVPSVDSRPSELDPYPRTERDLGSAVLWQRSLHRSHRRRIRAARSASQRPAPEGRDPGRRRGHPRRPCAEPADRRRLGVARRGRARRRPRSPRRPR